MKKITPFLVVAIVAGFLGFYFGSQQTAKDFSLAEQEKFLPVAENQLDKNFDFKLNLSPEEEINLKMVLVNAKKVKTVATNNQPLQANPGKEFLVLTLEYENSHSQALRVDSQSFFRLIRDEKKHAADFYNGQIELPAISVKKDEIGFVVEGEKSFKLQVGQVEGEKEEIEINF